MLRPCRVAVAPELGAVHRAAAGCLIDEALRHQGDFIQKNSSQGNALHQILGAFVLTAKDVVIILGAAPGDNHQVIRPPVAYGVSPCRKHLLEHR